MRLLIKVFLALSALTLCDGHGISKHTRIVTTAGLQYAHKLYESRWLQKAHIVSYDFQEKSISEQNLVAIARGTSDTHVHITVEAKQPPLCCTPEQPFYVSARGGWIPAHDLCVGDALLKADGQAKTILALEYLHKPLEIYALEIANTHVFCVGKDKIITHNMALPVSIWAGLEWAFGAGTAAGSAGAFLGPVTCVAGAALGGLITLTAQYCRSKRTPNYTYRCPISDLNEHHRQTRNYSKNGILLAAKPETLQNSCRIQFGGGNQDQNCWCGHPCGFEKCCNCDCICKSKKRIAPVENAHPNGMYHNVDYHHKNSKGNSRNGKSPAPIDGQRALDQSLEVPGDTKRRIGISNGQIVVLDQTLPELFHGHVRTFKELSSNENLRKVLNRMIQDGLINKKGKVLKQ